MNQDAGNGREYFGAVAKALARALVKVAEDEYQRLSKELNGDRVEIAKAVEKALRELRELWGNKMPCYNDDWVPLLYSTWYQPSHVNLAYSMIEQRREDDALTKTGRLHVVDFGCGPLAMQFGVALAVADALQRGERIDSIRVDLVDSSRGMIDMGRKIWCQFKEEIREDRQLAPLIDACSLVKSKMLEDIERTDVCEGEDRWISAIHAVYEENKCEVETDLNKLGYRMNPDVGFVTSHIRNSSLYDLDLRFGDSRYLTVLSQLSCTPSQVKDWRTCLYTRVVFGHEDAIIRQGVNIHFIHKYLSNEVPIGWGKVQFRLYTKEQQP